ncbi:UPF0496 protein At4g34320 [Rosa chinensis]|nr:UPF0496 protein At4g34320 [Rosa chinensis]XP_024196735.1 UPF0496 protein At4g34320 [Rosa chinensis]
MGGKRELIRRSWMSLKDLCRREADWNSYKVACEEDADLKSFDADVQSRTTKVISTLQNGGVSTDYVSDAIAYVTEFNKQTVDAIRVCREDITSGAWKNKKKKIKSEESFKVVVEEYVDNSQEMLDFCSVLDKFLKSARNNHFEIEQVIQQCEMETDPEGGNKYVRISRKLKSLKASAHHYDSANRLLEKIQSLQAKNQGLIDKLKIEYEKLANKRKSVRAWKKAVNMIFITTVAAQVISAVAVLAMANPAASAAIAVTIAPVIGGHQWALGLLAEYEKSLNDDKVILQTMHDASVFCIKELGDVKFLIDKVVNEIDAVLFHDCHADSAMEEGQVENAIKNIKSKLDMFLKKIEILEEKGETCSSEVLKSRDKVVRSMKA